MNLLEAIQQLESLGLKNFHLDVSFQFSGGETGPATLRRVIYTLWREGRRVASAGNLRLIVAMAEDDFKSGGKLSASELTEALTQTSETAVKIEGKRKK